LFNDNHLMAPSLNFTANVLAAIQKKESLVLDPNVNAVGKNVTYLIFGLIALINLVVIYIIWPYVSVWLPEEGILRYLLENMNTVFLDYAIRIFSRTASFSLIFIIALALFSLFGIDDFLRKRFRILQNSGFMF
jgi:polyferredoxin